jgi:hypothetical protein
MTMKPTGDKGQRYEVACFGYPIEGELTVCGWTEWRTVAETMASSFIMAPSCRRVEIRDRWGKEELDKREKSE